MARVAGGMGGKDGVKSRQFGQLIPANQESKQLQRRKKKAAAQKVLFGCAFYHNRLLIDLHIRMKC